MPLVKQAGLGDNFYIAGYDLSGDVASVDTMSGALDVLDLTPINASAPYRQGGLKNSAWSFTSYFESAPTVSTPGVPASGTPVVSTYNYSVLVTVTGGTGTQVNINGVNQGSFDGTYVLPALGSITLTYSVAPTWSWVAIGTEHQALSVIPTADVVATYFRGTTIGQPAASTVAKQTDYDPTRDNVGNLTLKVDLVGDRYGMDWGTMLTGGLRTDKTATTGAFYDQGTPTTTAFGCQAYLQLVEFVGTSVDVTITHATTSGGTYSTLIDFGSQTAIGGFRVATSNVTNVNEFLKVNTSGTFTWAVFAVMINRNLTAGVSF
jgi:hypothetical protein